MTALVVAAGRAVESSRPDRLVDDPYAKAFVEASRAPFPFPPRPDKGESGRGLPWDSIATYVGVRARFFDEFVAGAFNDGATQVVILASGLDSRSCRLAWPAGAVVYELDAPEVLRFKDGVLGESGARHGCPRQTVGCDLRAPWSAELLAAGFDRDRPTAWLAEGLLPFLSDDASDRLFVDIQGLSAPGSQFAAEYGAGDSAALIHSPQFKERTAKFGLDLAAMLPESKSFDPVDWLTKHGWSVATDNVRDVAEKYLRPLPDQVSPIRADQLVTAVRR
ncbi:SAM-dependent methyltransferase [Amycolatopsis japonica]